MCGIKLTPQTAFFFSGGLYWEVTDDASVQCAGPVCDPDNVPFDHRACCTLNMAPVTTHCPSVNAGCYMRYAIIKARLEEHRRDKQRDEL